jgi:hypothetical protein
MESPADAELVEIDEENELHVTAHGVRTRIAKPQISQMS